MRRLTLAHTRHDLARAAQEPAPPPSTAPSAAASRSIETPEQQLAPVSARAATCPRAPARRSVRRSSRSSTAVVHQQLAGTCSPRASASARVARLAPPVRRPSAAQLLPTARSSDAVFDEYLRSLDREKFWAWVLHFDNATHFKSSGNLHWWSAQLDTLRASSDVGFIRHVWLEFGCPGHGKGPWDGLGAVIKNKVTRDITNGLVEPKHALDVAKHVRQTFCTQQWLEEHARGTIKQMVVFYIDTAVMEARFPAVEPVYGTLAGISSAYCFMALGQGRVGKRRFSCWCGACLRAFGSGAFELAPHAASGCDRSALTSFSVERIACSRAVGIGNAKTRARELVRRLLASAAPGQFAAVQAREPWCAAERINRRPGHYWLCELGDAGGGSPILKTFVRREFFKGIRFDEGDSALLIRRYLDRVPDDPDGLTFVEWTDPKQDMLFVNSSELRAVGVELTRCESARTLRPPRVSARKQPARPDAQRGSGSPPDMRFVLSPVADSSIREVCEDS